jgi:hypothetical protein
MTAPAIDGVLLRLAPGQPVPLDAGLLRARDSIRIAITDLTEVSDSTLELLWPWRGEEADVRYGFYRQSEALADTLALIRPLLEVARVHETPARPLVAAASAARWDLHGLLAGLTDDELDKDPGNGEWTVRQTLAHIVSVQRAYGVFTAWWLARRDAPTDDFPRQVPEELDAELPAEEAEGVGSVAEIQRRLDEILDLSAGVFAPLGAEMLGTRARWAGIPVDVRFRLLRWASHLREHTIQVEKTLGFIGRPITEVERLLRVIAAAYGRLEEELFMWPAGGVPAEALGMAELVARGVSVDAAKVRESAGVGADG